MFVSVRTGSDLAKTAVVRGPAEVTVCGGKAVQTRGRFSRSDGGLAVSIGGERRANASTASRKRRPNEEYYHKVG